MDRNDLDTPLLPAARDIPSRMKRNLVRVGDLLSGRRVRARRAEHKPLRPGRRPQDIVAFALLTVGLAIVLLDIPSTPWLRSLPPQYRNTFSALTDIGKSDWILISTGVICLALLTLEARRLRFRLRMGVAAAWTYLGFLFYTVAASGLLAIVLKWCFGRARPKLYEELGPVAFEPFIFHGAHTSFPSGHSTTVGALAMALALIFPAWRWLIGVVAFWAAFSRIMVGAHYPSDVIAGTLLGVTFTYFSARYLARRRLGFHFTEAGSIRPIMGPVSAGACLRAFGSVLRRRSGLVAGAQSAAAGRVDTAKDEGTGE